MKRLKFILIDDNLDFRKALKTLLIDQYDANILAEASNAEETLKIENLHHADVILMDIMMPAKNGIELAKELLWFRNQKLKIIAITMHADNVYLTTLIEAGFKGCIYKNDIIKQLDEALAKVTVGELHFPENIKLGYVNRLKQE